MKKEYLVVLIFIILLIPVYAINGLITEADFSSQDTRAYKLEEGDGISFEIDNKSYIISIDELGKDSLRLKSFIYKDEERETFYLPLNKMNSYKIDFDKDNFNDIKIELYEVNYEENKATLIFKKINEPKEVLTGQTVNENKQIFNTKGIIVTALIVLAGLIAYFTFRKK